MDQTLHLQQLMLEAWVATISMQEQSQTQNSLTEVTDRQSNLPPAEILSTIRIWPFSYVASIPQMAAFFWPSLFPVWAASFTHFHWRFPNQPTHIWISLVLQRTAGLFKENFIMDWSFGQCCTYTHSISEQALKWSPVEPHQWLVITSILINNFTLQERLCYCKRLLSWLI